MTKPGIPPPNEPADFEYLTDNRLLNNGNITRMPTTQQQWNTFIVELNKWVKNETGSFDIGGSETAQFTGFSADPASANIWWHRYGQLVHIQFHFTTGTSDDTDFTITGIPENITPRDDIRVLCPGLMDNGSNLTEIGSVVIASSGTIIFYTTEYGNLWTGSSTKGFADSGKYSVIYSLRQPGKH